MDNTQNPTPAQPLQPTQPPVQPQPQPSILPAQQPVAPVTELISTATAIQTGTGTPTIPVVADGANPDVDENDQQEHALSEKDKTNLVSAKLAEPNPISSGVSDVRVFEAGKLVGTLNSSQPAPEPVQPQEVKPQPASTSFASPQVMPTTETLQPATVVIPAQKKSSKGIIYLVLFVLILITIIALVIINQDSLKDLIDNSSSTY